MASYDLRKIYYAKYLDTGGAPSYSGGRKMGDAMSAEININNSDAPLYAEGHMSENIRQFLSGTVAVGVKNLDQQTRIDLYGRTQTTRSITSGGAQKSITGTKGSDTDEPNAVGVGFATPIKDNEGGDESGWYVVRYNKVMFSEPSKKTATRGNSITWQSPVTNGSIMIDIAGDWYEDGVCETLAEAELWIKDALSIVA